jgi:hypothetical protein
MFTFHAQQGQHNQIARILTATVGKPRLSRTDKGVMVELRLPDGISKRFVDRLLHGQGVPGASSRRNRFRVVSHNGWWDTYKIVEAIGRDTLFKAVVDGKFVGLARVNYYDYGCTCCGGYDRVQILLPDGSWSNP